MIQLFERLLFFLIMEAAKSSKHRTPSPMKDPHGTSPLKPERFQNLPLTQIQISIIQISINEIFKIPEIFIQEAVVRIYIICSKNPFPKWYIKGI
ncbi:hypothetical protein V6Z12_D11G275900 [Gossypium hirsutum]